MQYGAGRVSASSDQHGKNVDRGRIIQGVFGLYLKHDQRAFRCNLERSPRPGVCQSSRGLDAVVLHSSDARKWQSEAASRAFESSLRNDILVEGIMEAFAVEEGNR